MGIKPAAVVFWLSLVAELGLVTFLAIWPIRDSIKHAESLQDWLDLYSVDSNLDVWLLCIAHCLLLPLCFLRVAGRACRHRKRYGRARLTVSLLVYTCQVQSLCRSPGMCMYAWAGRCACCAADPA